MVPGGDAEGRNRRRSSSLRERRYHRAVRKLIKIALIVLGIRWFLRWRKRRRAEAELATAPAGSADPADELRQKLAASREEAVDDEPEATPEASVDDRRGEVHEQGRATVDEMKSSGEG
jgi:hypothetical protein